MSAGWRAVVGGVVWAGLVAPRVPNLHHGQWAQALIAFAALALVPLAIEVADGPRRRPAARQALGWAARLQLPAAGLLIVGFRLEAGMLAVGLSAGWVAVLLLLAASGAVQGWKSVNAGAVTWCNEAGLLFAAVGAVWLVADRAGIRPLGFSEDIVLLTAVHFHYAGLILPMVAGRALQAVAPGRGTTAIALAVIAGVPAVAIGITTSQLGLGNGIESAAALVMSIAGAAVAIVHVRLGLGLRQTVAVRCLWMVAGCSLFAGMLLSALYGMRGFFSPWPWLDIPWMRALHGTMNAIGFGFAGTLAWWLAGQRRPVSLQNTLSAR